jgi:hypothetical protein
VQPFPAIFQGQEYGTSREPSLQFSGNESNIEGHDSWSWRITPEVQQEFIHNEPELEQPSVSMETLEQFSSEDYQQLLTTMVSQIPSAVLNGPELSDSRFLEDSRGGENKSPQLIQGEFIKDEKPGQIVQFKHTSAIPRPSNFSISSVDPLHFLGITPTVQSAELLQACKNIHLKLHTSKFMVTNCLYSP